MSRMPIPTMSLDDLRDEIARLDIKRNTLMHDAFDAIDSGALAKASTIHHEIVQLEDTLGELKRRKFHLEKKQARAQK